MKVSVITAVFNRAGCIADAVRSVQQQSYKNVEHVVIDGASSDGTLDILGEILKADAILISEPDHGIYDALNKGIACSTGEIIGFLHSDDYFSDSDVLEQIAEAFRDNKVDAVYGDLDYVAKGNIDSIIRHWISGEYTHAKLAWGWMPPHPTLFLRRSVIEKWGGFDTRYRISADYDAILRYFNRGKIQAKYLPRVLVKMRVGGESNRSLQKILRKTCEDYIALREHRVGGLGALICKNVGKLKQFIT